MIQSIQMLRFAAALWVAAYHALQSGWLQSLPMWIQTIFGGGYAGVDIFFVISGFIMALSTTRSPAGVRSAVQFALTRFSRIYTAWWPVMLVSLITLSSLGALPSPLNLWSSALLYPSNFSQHIINVIWTLVYELYFYLLVAISLLLTPSWRGRFLGLFAAAITGLVLYYWCTDRYLPSAFARATPLVWFYAAPLVLEFFAGYFLYFLVQRWPQQSAYWWWQACGLLTCVAVYMAWYQSPNTPGMTGFFHWPERTLWIGSAAVALVGATLFSPVPRGRMMQSLICFGDYSFAIYLLHPLVLALAGSGLAALAWQPSSAIAAMWTGTVLLIALVTLSALYYRYIEHPIYQACRRKIGQWLAPRS